MAIQQEVLAFLEKDPILRVLPIETIKRRDAAVTAVVKDGVLLYDTANDMHLLCADTKEAALALIPHLPARPDCLTNDFEPLNEHLIKRFKFTSKMVCINTVYTSKTPVPVVTDLTLKTLGVQALDLIQAHYRSGSEEYLRDILGRGRLLGGFLGDTMVGFIGWHDEGSMGLLHIFEEHRRRGYAFQMEALQINGMLKKSQLPFGQVETYNQASLALQKKIGMELSEKTVSWLFA